MIISWWHVGESGSYRDVSIDDLRHLVHDQAGVAWDRDLEDILPAGGLKDWAGSESLRPVRMLGQLDGGCYVLTGGGSGAPFAEWDVEQLRWVPFGHTIAASRATK